MILRKCRDWDENKYSFMDTFTPGGELWYHHSFYDYKQSPVQDENENGGIWLIEQQINESSS